MGQFSRNLNLPDYLEEALAPFWWSSILSNTFRSDILSCIIAEKQNRKAVVADFVASLKLIQFLDRRWAEQLSEALERFAEEGFVKR